jgi:hypothetical protein
MLAVLRHRRGTAADLVRLVAYWLAAIVLVQGLAATLTLVHGPAHRHAEVVLRALGDSHAHAHATLQAHFHDASALAVPVEGEAALDAAALMLLATLAMLVSAFAWPTRFCGTAPAVSPPWSVLAHVRAPPRKPPRG